MISALLAKQQLDAMKANTAATQAQADKTTVEAKLLSADLPYSADNARAKRDQLGLTLLKTTNEIANLQALTKLQQVDYDLRELDLETQSKLSPLRVQAQALLNESTRLGQQLTKQQALNLLWDAYGKQLDSAEKRASYKFWENVPASKWIQIIRQLAGK